MYLDACLRFSVRIRDFFSLYCHSDYFEKQSLRLFVPLSKWSREQSLNAHTGAHEQTEVTVKKKLCTNTSYSSEWGQEELCCIFIGFGASRRGISAALLRLTFPSRGNRRNTHFHILSKDGKVTSLLTLPKESLIYASF